MAAQVVTASRTESDRIGPSWTRLVHLLLLFTVFMLLLLTTWLLVRRMDGQLRQPLGFLPLAVVGIAAAALASLLRWAWYQTGLRPRHWKSRTTLCWIVPSIAVLMFAMSLSITGTGTAALVFFWGTCWWWKERGGGSRAGCCRALVVPRLCHAQVRPALCTTRPAMQLDRPWHLARHPETHGLVTPRRETRMQMTRFRTKSLNN